MKKQLFLFTIIIFMMSSFVSSQVPFGVNLAGAEFGTNMPGTYNIDYTYPTSSELDYYKSKGLNLVRLPIRWERIQESLNGDINSAELLRINSFLQSAQDRNMEVIIDLHNYCRYKINGNYEIIGSASLSISNIKDMWTKLSFELRDSPNIWGYGIMNEPHDLLPSTPWFNIAQEIIYGIRSSDVDNRIIVGGDSWSSAERWLQYSDNLKDLIDPSNNLIFEAHVYFDNNASGSYNQSYDEEGAYPNIGVDRVTPFVNWLEDNNLTGFIGEYGIPADDERWLVVLDIFLSHLEQNCINGTYWAGGPWWGNYKLSIEPYNGNDKPQMGVVEKYLNTNIDCSTLIYNNLNESSTDLSVYPNPFSTQIVIKKLKNADFIEIYGLNGKLHISKKVKGTLIDGLDFLKPGLYIVRADDGRKTKIVKY
ncbi:MAG: cellulase family glycosylhydrolase [Bacteroidales bacterium]|jgi:endoglucanase|nr:cellulase family glycosylhydrolase [Bacteroidales bacterium]